MSDSWLKAFQLDPARAVADLFSGRAELDCALRLDLPERLSQAFPAHRVEERTRLDEALWTWLFDMREHHAVEVERLGSAVYGKRLCDALTALQLLELPRTRRHIREDLDAWLRWLRPLRRASERDPALECLRLIALGQPDTGHVALWLRLAEDPRPKYLSVALAGLQGLPHQGDARTSHVLMVQALLRHAVEVRDEGDAAWELFDERLAA